MKRIDRKVAESSSFLGRDGASVAGDSGDDTEKYGEDVSLVEGSPTQDLFLVWQQNTIECVKRIKHLYPLRAEPVHSPGQEGISGRS